MRYRIHVPIEVTNIQQSNQRACRYQGKQRWVIDY